MGRSIVAVLVGMVVWAVLWVSGNAGLRALMPDAFDPEGTTQSGAALALILVESVVLSVLAGYVTAALARRRMVTHAVVLGFIQLALGIMVQVSVWERMPLWYHLSFLALLIPANVLGGVWRVGGTGQARREPTVVAG